ncbi:hypothetical protein [Streptomyces sp. NPDC001568]|uniref:hypothetical protein n=1 Tax=Streptomyces sp. NPDC001568 TaxID=3364588 RepID=UPI0036A4B0E7
MMAVVTAAAALAAGHLLGRLRPWRRAGDCAADLFRSTGAWVRGSAGRQAFVFLVHVVTAPRTSRRFVRASATDRQVRAPADAGRGAQNCRASSEPFRGQAATLEELRVDRQLEEALAHGPDPLHLAEVFGSDEKTAIRCANSARALLDQDAEQQLR